MADYAGVLAELKAKLVAMDAARAELVTAITAIQRLHNSSASPTAPIRRAFAPTPPETQDPMPVAIERCMEEVGRMMETREVVDALKASGFKASPKSYRAQVYNTLWRLTSKDNSKFARSGNRWGLKKWKE